MKTFKYLDFKVTCSYVSKEGTDDLQKEWNIYQNKNLIQSLHTSLKISIKTIKIIIDERFVK